MYYKEFIMTLSLRLNDKESALFKNYAKLNGITVSELIRKSVLEKIEDEHDLAAYEKAYAEYKADPVTFTLDEVEESLNLK